MRSHASLPTCIVVGIACLAGSVRAAEKWLYVSRNLQVDESVTQIAELLRRAEAAGYTHMLLTDSKFSRLGTVIDRYFDNVRARTRAGPQHHIEIVPTLFSIGYSNDLLSHDPNLAESAPGEGAAAGRAERSGGRR